METAAAIRPSRLCLRQTLPIGGCIGQHGRLARHLDQPLVRRGCRSLSAGAIELVDVAHPVNLNNCLGFLGHPRISSAISDDLITEFD
jgi:hypothetical protein